MASGDAPPAKVEWNGVSYRALGDEPGGITVEHGGIAGMAAANFVKNGRRDVNDFAAGFFHRDMQPGDSLLESPETRFVKGQINAVVHAVTGENQIGFSLRQHARKPFV